MRNISDIRADYPEFDSVAGHQYRCLAMTLDSGHYVVLTDKIGLDYPTPDDFLLCVYRDEESFGDDPSDSVIVEFSSNDCASIDDAIDGAISIIEA